MSQDQEACPPSPDPLMMLDEEHIQKGKEAELSSVSQVLVGRGLLRMELCPSPITRGNLVSPSQSVLGAGISVSSIFPGASVKFHTQRGFTHMLVMVKETIYLIQWG